MDTKLATQRLQASILACLVLASAGPAAGDGEESLIAGWDFSQYSNIGFLSFDGTTITGSTLLPNHSDLDPTNRQGLESNGFGVMHLDGLFRSTATPLDGSDPFVPQIDTLGTGGSLLSNADQGFLGFGSPAACTNAGVELMPNNNCSDFVMIASDAVTVVFEANRFSAPVSGSWSISFAGKTEVSGTNSVGVVFTPDGGSASDMAIAQLSEVDTEYSFDFGAEDAQRVFIALSFSSPEPDSRALIDNVGIAVPEAGNGAAAAALVLGWLRRRRSARATA